METLQTIKNIAEDGNMSRITRQQFADLSEEIKYQKYVNEEYRGDTYKRIAVQLELWRDGSQGHKEALEDLHSNDKTDSRRNGFKVHDYSLVFIDEVNDFQGVSPCLK
jgi:phage protein D